MRGRFLAKPRGARRERAPGGPKDARDICISLHFLFGIERFQSLATHPTGALPSAKVITSSRVAGGGHWSCPATAVAW